MTLSIRLSKLRDERGVSLQTVADAVGVSKAHIWEMERGKAANPSMDLVRRLADYYKVSIASLVEEDIHAEDADQELAAMFRKAQGLSDRDRAVLKGMLDTLLSNQD